MDSTNIRNNGARGRSDSLHNNSSRAEDTEIMIAGTYASSSLQHVQISNKAKRTLAAGTVKKALEDHCNGQWGEISAEDAAENEWSFREGGRVLSRYSNSDNKRFYVITDIDDNTKHTRILMADEYHRRTRGSVG